MRNVKAVVIGVVIGLPGVGFADDAAELFNKKCATCHGKDGKGDTTMGKKVNVANLTDPARQDKLTDAAVQSRILDGVTDKDTGKQRMPPSKGKLSDGEVAGLVKYVRAFRSK